ncbi:MAG TPA: SMP-30/gluconolactonase/LRE family protein [Rhizobiaceae bacterium]|nr:SMP-30/gluconolactonase/LRE family protein [Rhizobiaceae bacterium]
MGANVFSDVVCELGEGPAYDPDSETLFWFDINGKKLLAKKWPNGETVVHELPVMASAIAVIDGGRQLIATETGLHIRDARTGTLTLHKEMETDLPGNRSNDSRVHPSGAFWIGTMPKDESINSGAFYWYFKGEMKTLYTGVKVPNSICFSPDGRVAYFIDTETKSLKRVDVDPSNGFPTGAPKEFVRGGSDGWIDGSVCDADGVVWNAKWGGSRVDAYSPDGTLIKSVPVPAVQSSCPAFLGPNASRMAVTSAWKGMNATQRAADPEGGKTFLLDIVVKGRFEPKVAL